MAEAVVCIVVDQLVSVAGDWLQEEISLLRGVKTKLDNVKRNLQIIQTVLQDAENQSVKKEIVKSWLVNLQDVSYDMDDVLDEWSTRILILKREEVEEDNTSHEIVGSSSSSSPTTCFSLKKLNCFPTVKQLPWRRNIAKRIKGINERIDLVFLDMEQFKLVSKAVANDRLNKIINHNDIARTTTSFVDDSKVHGRGDEKELLLSKVLSVNTEQEKSLQVISIVGPGGLGKSTLAQMVYNDEQVKEKFGEKRIWVCVSNPFDEVKVSKDILEGLDVDHTKMNSLQTLHRSVEESLSGDTFLLVLDDVWDENFGKWDRLSKCLMLGEPESRILVTTRNEKVATIMDTTPSNILKPQLISNSDCWLLMSRIAFQGRTNGNDELDEIGKKISEKCKGLPLAAKTLGGMLISEDSVDKWKEILKSEIWELEQAEVELFPHIFLSYQELPPLLKRCFLILAMFPKDTKLAVKEVIAIWMAHGFLKQGTKAHDMVKTGNKYLAFLVSRGLLEDKHATISMHDIMHHFALHLLGDEISSIQNDCSSESTSKGGSHLKSRTTRHLYMYGNIDQTLIGFDVEKLRTCIIHDVAPNVTSDLVKRLRMVRALFMVACGLEQVPQSISKLIHLRLLDLRDNPLIELPETIGGLYNLHHLFLDGCDLSLLPNSTGELANLILLKPDHLVLKMAPESAGKLINIQNLGIVEVEAGKSKLRFLKDLNQLRGELVIEFISDYDDEVDSKKAAIEMKNHLTEVDLRFNYHEVTYGVIAALQPPSNIQVLQIYDLPSSCDRLPNWITSLDHLTKLDIYGGGNISTLPPLGKLRSLKKLHISEFNALKIIGREFLGTGSNPEKNCCAFPKLVKLVFFECKELTGWEDLQPEEEDLISVMPNLEKLWFKECSKLDKLPRRLLGQAPSLKNIVMREERSINEEDSYFNFDIGKCPCRLFLGRNRQGLEMIVEGSRKVPKSIIYHSYITKLLDIYFAELRISYLPSMGNLPYLQSLSISNLSSLEVIGRDFLGIDDPNNDEDSVAFPNLLLLDINGCDLLKEWEDLKPEDKGTLTIMPKLRGLQIMGCLKLQVLPSRLLCRAASLEEIRCYNNNESLAENIMKDEQLLRHVKTVYVNEQQCSLHPSTERENEEGSGCTEYSSDSDFC